MFIKASVFERMLKTAWNKYGLHIQRDDEAIGISGGYWAVWIKYEEMPKEYLGSIIKVTGYIPEIGEEVLCTSDSIQQEVGCSSLDLMDRAMKAETKVIPTNVIIIGCGIPFRMMVGADNSVGSIYEPALQSVDATQIDRKAGHTSITGPVKGARENKFFWYNNVMALSIRTNDTPPAIDDDVEAIGEYLLERELGNDDSES